MTSRHGLEVSHNAVASFMKTHGLSRKSFLDGISETRKRELLKQLKAVWTHDSTSIEGNTLSLGDTMAVLEYGLTVKGKPLKDHQDVVSHAKGVDFVQSLIGRKKIAADDIFAMFLHCTALSLEMSRATSTVPSGHGSARTTVHTVPRTAKAFTCHTRRRTIRLGLWTIGLRHSTRL